MCAPSARAPRQAASITPPRPPQSKRHAAPAQLAAHLFGEPQRLSPGAFTADHGNYHGSHYSRRFVFSAVRAGYGVIDQLYGAFSAVPSVAPDTTIVSVPSSATCPRFAASSSSRVTCSPANHLHDELLRKWTLDALEPLGRPAAGALRAVPKARAAGPRCCLSPNP